MNRPTFFKSIIGTILSLPLFLLGKKQSNDVRSFEIVLTNNFPHPRHVVITVNGEKIHYYLDGEVQFMRDWNRALTRKEVKALYNAQPIKEKYFDIACKRIDQAQRQGQFFQPSSVPTIQETMFDGQT